MENLHPLPAHTILEQLIAKHGRLKITALVLGMIFRTYSPRIRPSDLSDHLRRDVGLEHAPPSPTYHDFL